MDNLAKEVAATVGEETDVDNEFDLSPLLPKSKVELEDIQKVWAF